MNVRIALQALIVAAVLACAGSATAQQRQPDVFLITIDTLRADHVGAYGYTRIKTPALDRLARDGILFSQAFTPSPITNSSHASIFTGLYPSSHGVTDFGVPLRRGAATWAELLKQKGYRTAAFIGAVILDSNGLAPGFDRGFDTYTNFPAVSARDGKKTRGVERRGNEVVAMAERWLLAHPASPRFVWVHLYDPHDPYEPPAPFAQEYAGRPYDGEIAYADSALGKLLALLDRRGWYAPALVVVVGDHGEGLGEHEEETHGVFLYDATTHVPLIFKLPVRAGTPAAGGKTAAMQVRTVDILPTVLDLVGDTGAHHFDGQTLRAALEAKPLADLLAPAETDYPLHFGWAPLRAMRAEGAKLIEAPRPEFYELKSDPGELHNGYESWNPAVQRLRTMLKEQLKPTSRVSAGAVDPRTIEELRALGYLGNDPGATSVPEPSLLPDAKDKIAVQNLLHAAMLQEEHGRASDARDGLQRAAMADPQSSVVLVQWGRLELAHGDAAKAAEILARARKLRPEDATIMLLYGRALLALGELGPAREALTESLRLSPRQAAARIALAQVYERSGDMRAAEDQLEAAVLAEPKSQEAKFEYARFLRERRQKAGHPESKSAQPSPK